MSFIVVQMLPTEPAKYPNQAAAVQMVQMTKYPNQIKLKVNSSVSFWVVPVLYESISDDVLQQYFI